MKPTLQRRALASGCVVVTSLALAASAAETPPTERFVATAVSIAHPGPTGAGMVEIGIERWSTDAEHARLVTAMIEAGPDKLLDTLQRMPRAERDARVAESLELVGLGGHAAQRPYELSGGQQQRVGIARALAARPELLLADEPTGQLDSGTAATVMDLIGELVHARGVAAVVTTHDAALVRRADRVLELHDGRTKAPSIT